MPGGNAVPGSRTSSPVESNATRNRRKTGFTLPINEWLKEEGRVECGKRSWARKVYEVMFASDRGRY